MESLLVNIKFVVRIGILSFTFAGLVACKETDGFSAATFDGAFAAQADTAKQAFTPEAVESLQTRMSELENIEEDIALKDENITGLQAQIEELKAQIEENNETLNSSNTLSEDVVKQLAEQNEKNRTELESVVLVYNQYVQDRIEKDQELMSRFTEMVTELAKYETTADSTVFQEGVVKRLKTYEADRERLAEMIAAKEEIVADLNNRLKNIESNTTPEAAAEKAKLSEDLVSNQESLNEMNVRLSSLESLVEVNGCIVDPSKCGKTETVAAMAVPKPTGDALELEAIDDKSKVTIALGEELKKLQVRKNDLRDLMAELEVEILAVDTQIAMLVTTSAASSVASGKNLETGVLAQLNDKKTELLNNKSDLLSQIGDLDRKISLQVRQIVAR